MRLDALCLLILVGAFGCVKERPLQKASASEAQHASSWRAFLENGDKPGIGIELRTTKAGVTGIYYLMDPNDPANFHRGRKVKMRTLQDDPKYLIFAVTLPGIGDREVHIRFDRPLEGDRVRGMIGRTPSLALPLEFKRLRS